MLAILKKELWGYFGTYGAYVVALLFSLISALFLWYLDSDFNIFNIGSANLNSFFSLSPLILMLLIPALTMKSFSEEYTLGTLQWLFTKPINTWEIILGKFISLVILILFCLFPTLIFVYSINDISLPEGTLDLGIVVCGYIGLLLISLGFISIGIFCSIIAKNQILAFLLGVFLNFIVFFGLEKIASFDLFGTYDYWVQKIGFAIHYNPFTKGLLDTRDLGYFLFVVCAFLIFSNLLLKKLK